MAQQQDPTISRIREVRHLISEKFGHDPHKIVAYYMERQKDHDTDDIKGSEEEGKRPREEQGLTKKTSQRTSLAGPRDCKSGLN